VLTILNLPHWLCNKIKYITLSGLIPGTRQHGNDIDTYLRPLLEDQKGLMWYNRGGDVWDEHKHEYFQLQAILFVTIIDSLAAHNL
jgi:hypothetical protein